MILIPNIVEVAKKYLTHEQETLTQVIEARNSAKGVLDSIANNPNAITQLNAAEKTLQNALMNFQMTMETYPNLKADTLMKSLTEELTSTKK